MQTTGSADPAVSLSSESPAVVDAVETALKQCPHPGPVPSHNPWPELLYSRLRDEALPALIVDEAITPAGSLWTGARLWTEAFRNADLQSGDRLIIALPPSPAFIQVLVAALWEGLTVAPAPPSVGVPELLHTLDARAAVTTAPGPSSFVAHDRAGPTSTPSAVRAADSGRTPDVRFLLRTSGTTGEPQWIALSDRNVLSVLASHLPHLSLDGARVLSVLPWTHAFGLVLELFPALLSGAEVIRDPTGGRDPEGLVDLFDTWGGTHLFAVPLVIKRLLDTPGGSRLLDELDGGIVGGAPVSGPLAAELPNTALRAGYGQTEASPGITLGPPGEWAPQYIGQPVGCSVEVGSHGELCFQGANACVGIWRERTLHRADPDRWVRTGDLAERDGNDFYFRGRKDHAVKLSNGRWVDAGALEADLKTTIPALHDALVFTPNGDDVAVALCIEKSARRRSLKTTVCSVLDSLEQRLVWMPTLKPTEWTTTAKGSVDRSAMIPSLTETYRRTVE